MQDSFPGINGQKIIPDDKKNKLRLRVSKEGVVGVGVGGVFKASTQQLLAL